MRCETKAVESLGADLYALRAKALILRSIDMREWGVDSAAGVGENEPALLGLRGHSTELPYRW